MNDTRTTHTQDLREAVASIISMMLGLLRAQGWRGLLHLPEIVMVVFLLRSIGKRFAALMDAHAAGLPVAPPPAMAPPPEPAYGTATPRIRARASGPRQSRRAGRQPARPQPARSTRVRTVPRPFLAKPLPAALVLVRASAMQKNPVLAC